MQTHKVGAPCTWTDSASEGRVMGHGKHFQVTATQSKTIKPSTLICRYFYFETFQY